MEELGVGSDEIQAQDAGRVAGPHDRAGIVGVRDALEDDAQVGLAVGEDALDLLDPLLSVACRNYSTILEMGPLFPYSYRSVPVWRNWQTRGTQNPVSSNRRVGSIPSTGTIQLIQIQLFIKAIPGPRSGPFETA